MISTVIKRGLVTLAMATAAALGTTTAAYAGTESTPPAAAMATWEWAGSYPEPLICNIAGATSGRDWYCSWSLFWWDLYLKR